MANPAAALKRVPKWAWFVAAGVGVGGIALKRRQDAKAESEAAVTGTDPVTGQTTGTAPPGVIVPPVITGGGSGEAAQVDPSVPAIYSGLNDVFSSGFAGILDTIGRHDDALITLVANGGAAPNPAAQEPPVINVNFPAPAPTPAPVPTATSNTIGCPPKFPRGNPSTGCYNACGHDDCRNGKVYRVSGHCYEKTGMKVLTATPTGKKC